MLEIESDLLELHRLSDPRTTHSRHPGECVRRWPAAVSEHQPAPAAAAAPIAGPCSCHMCIKARHHHAPSAPPRKKVRSAPLLLLLLLCAILVRASYAAPHTRTTPGERLILHTRQHRQRQHQQLLLEQRTRPPTATTTLKHYIHHMHNRAAGAMPSENAADVPDRRSSPAPTVYPRRCEAFNNFLHQANSSYAYVRAYIERYVADHYNNTVAGMHTQGEANSLQLEHPLQQHRLRNFDTDEVDDSVLPVGEEAINAEVVKIHKTLRLLNATIDSIAKDWHDKPTKYVNEHNASHYDRNMDLLDKLQENVRADFRKAGTVLKELAIPKPLDQSAPVYDDTVADWEWMLIKEYLSTLKYVRAFLTKSANACQP